jgi:hypothetical protein
MATPSSPSSSAAVSRATQPITVSYVRARAITLTEAGGTEDACGRAGATRVGVVLEIREMMGFDTFDD